MHMQNATNRMGKGFDRINLLFHRRKKNNYLSKSLVIAAIQHIKPIINKTTGLFEMFFLCL